MHLNCALFHYHKIDVVAHFDHRKSKGCVIGVHDHTIRKKKLETILCIFIHSFLFIRLNCNFDRFSIPKYTNEFDWFKSQMYYFVSLKKTTTLWLWPFQMEWNKTILYDTVWNGKEIYQCQWRLEERSKKKDKCACALIISFTNEYMCLCACSLLVAAPASIRFSARFAFNETFFPSLQLLSKWLFK